jgi:hypothetical protein
MLRNIYIMLLSTKSKNNDSLREVAQSQQKLDLDFILKQIETRTRKLADNYEKQQKSITENPILREKFTNNMRDLELERKRKKYANVKIKEQMEE